MKRIFGVLAVATLVLTGCPKENNMNINLDGGNKDQNTSGGDLTVAGNKKAIGEACTKNADCAGNLCFVETQGLFKGGYCTKACSLTGTDTCGDGFECGFDLTTKSQTAGKCYATCDSSTACRDGYACWVGDWLATFNSVCFPPAADAFNPDVLCDPTKTTNANCAADEICTRAIHDDAGAGGADFGVCSPTCVLGEGTCGTSGNCTLLSNAAKLNAAQDGFYSGDKGVAPQCIGFNTSIVTANAIGAACTFDYQSMTYNSAFACVDSAQCAITDQNDQFGSGDPLVTGGDNKCYQLCYKDGAIPVVNPDAGVEGTPFKSCAKIGSATTTCKDSFGLFNNTDGYPKVGLCQP